MIAFVPAALFFFLFCVSARADRRRFQNAVLLGLTLIFASAGVLFLLPALPWPLDTIAILLVFLVPTLGTLALGVFLIGNGLTMVRKEGRSPANLLSLAAGVAILALTALVVTVTDRGSHLVDSLVVGLVLLAGYVSFLFVCFLAYAYLYGRIKVRGNVDYVVMLGSGLIGGERVPPLLASRLDKGRRIHAAQLARGGPAPLLLASGGQGADERVPEARAMADWLLAQGVPRDHVRLEDRSRTTEENLRFSRALMEQENPGYRCVVVTNNFHAFRAAMTARKAGVNGQVLGSPTATYFWPSATIREFVAVFWEHRAVNLSICAAIAALTALVAVAT
ncbi:MULTISPECIES: YdcF family protein [unclassified Streptomyces]|uniref:YdcF family protein n=1 Tax=unclassified Streptomyces TaxID=2593676 RepID=UPI002254591D|nr:MULTISPECIES: YdcF family protein [unclassified Streptomyces]MCX4527771.1 YdcF family protein [Streptomyces sp. NBC_01551]MCX4541632.1 YdcF family protein [Streptomyces sp. NBC_01565]